MVNGAKLAPSLVERQSSLFEKLSAQSTRICSKMSEADNM
jgi:hypothetical protein